MRRAQQFLRFKYLLHSSLRTETATIIQSEEGTAARFLCFLCGVFGTQQVFSWGDSLVTGNYCLDVLPREGDGIKLPIIRHFLMT